MSELLYIVFLSLLGCSNDIRTLNFPENNLFNNSEIYKEEICTNSKNVIFYSFKHTGFATSLKNQQYKIFLDSLNEYHKLEKIKIFIFRFKFLETFRQEIEVIFDESINKIFLNLNKELFMQTQNSSFWISPKIGYDDISSYIKSISLKLNNYEKTRLKNFTKEVLIISDKVLHHERIYSEIKNIFYTYCEETKTEYTKKSSVFIFIKQICNKTKCNIFYPNFINKFRSLEESNKSNPGISGDISTNTLKFKYINVEKDRKMALESWNKLINLRYDIKKSIIFSVLLKNPSFNFSLKNCGNAASLSGLSLEKKIIYSIVKKLGMSYRVKFKVNVSFYLIFRIHVYKSKGFLYKFIKIDQEGSSKGLKIEFKVFNSDFDSFYPNNDEEKYLVDYYKHDPDVDIFLKILYWLKVIYFNSYYLYFKKPDLLIGDFGFYRRRVEIKIFSNYSDLKNIESFNTNIIIYNFAKEKIFEKSKIFIETYWLRKSYKNAYKNKDITNIKRLLPFIENHYFCTSYSSDFEIVEKTTNDTFYNVDMINSIFIIIRISEKENYNILIKCNYYLNTDLKPKFKDIRETEKFEKIKEILFDDWDFKHNEVENLVNKTHHFYKEKLFTGEKIENIYIDTYRFFIEVAWIHNLKFIKRDIDPPKIIFDNKIKIENRKNGEDIPTLYYMSKLTALKRVFDFLFNEWLLEDRTKNIEISVISLASLKKDLSKNILNAFKLSI